MIIAGRAGFGDDYLVQSYDARTGEFLWEDKTLGGSAMTNAAVAVDVERGLAFGAGWEDFNVSREACLVRAYDLDTGELLWEDRFSDTDPQKIFQCHTLDIAVDGKRLFSVGQEVHGTWFVRARDALDGDLLWHDEFEPPHPGAEYSRTQALATDGGRVFVVGSGLSAAGNEDFIVRAYDAR